VGRFGRASSSSDGQLTRAESREERYPKTLSSCVKSPSSKNIARGISCLSNVRDVNRCAAVVLVPFIERLTRSKCACERVQIPNALYLDRDEPTLFHVGFRGFSAWNCKGVASFSRDRYHARIDTLA